VRKASRRAIGAGNRADISRRFASHSGGSVGFDLQNSRDLRCRFDLHQLRLDRDTHQ
jgi:hypothetical protein